MASRYLCHERPDLLEFETLVVDARPGAVVLESSAFYPGGGQLPELLLHELRQADAVATVCRFAEKGLQVRADDGVEDAALRLAWAVDRALDSHGPQVGSELGP